MRRPRNAAIFVLACAACLAAAPPAAAQGRKPQGKQLDPRLAEAKRIFDDGAAAYGAGNYEEAIRLFEQSYAISQKPLIFESLANAWERLGNARKARDNLARWREAAPPEERDLLDARIRNLDARLAREDAAAQAATAAQAAREDKLRAAAVQPVDARPWLPGAIVGGAGVVAIVAGVAVDAVAAKDRPASSACKTTGMGTFCMSSASGAIATSNRMAIAGDVTWIVGAAAVATGAVLVVLRRPKQDAAPSPPPPAAYLAPLPGGVMLGGSF